MRQPGTLRNGLPRPSFIAFTATPITRKDANTRAIFGDSIDIPEIMQEVHDLGWASDSFISTIAFVVFVEYDQSERLSTPADEQSHAYPHT